MTSSNDITGDRLISKIGDKDAFDRNFDLIFRKKSDCECGTLCENCTKAVDSFEDIPNVGKANES